MDKYFSKDQMNISKLIFLIPEVLADRSNDSDIAEAGKFYERDTVSPDVIDVEFGR